VFNQVPAGHDVSDETAAYKLASEPFPGHFGIFYKASRPTKNTKEKNLHASHMEKVAGMKDWQILQKAFERMK
jgi:2-oxoglutarate/2-oxoacid ferredoxin oxidoreductase subunit beta